MRTIHHVIDVDAPPAEVWQALTTKEGLAGWWSDVVEVGGTSPGDVIGFTFAGNFNPAMQIEEVEEGRYLTWRCIGGHDNWADNTFVFELVSLVDEQTRVRFSQHYAVELSDDDYGTYNFNWGYYLESLRLHCTIGVGKPFRPPPR